MKKHIVRAPQTDRYGLDVPTKLSELEDDITTTRLALTSTVQVAGAAPVTANFQVDAGTFTGAAGTVVATGTAVTENVGFTLPSTGDLTIPIPTTGVYALNLIASWQSTEDTGGGVGVLTTYYDLSLLSAVADATGVIASFVGSVGLNNKMGTASLGGQSFISSNAVIPLTAGDVLLCGSQVLAESPALTADGILATITLQIVRIA